MSRIGRLPVALPQGVKVNIKGSEVAIKGDKGEIHRHFHPDITITSNDGELTVSRPSNNRTHCALHGLTRSLLANMVEGVSKGFEKVLEINGVGYKAQKVDDKLTLQIGYSHTVDVPITPDVDISVEGSNRIHVSGIDKEKVGEVAARIRAIRPADPYKGKGIKYDYEKLRLKPGKAGKALGKK